MAEPEMVDVNAVRHEGKAGNPAARFAEKLLGTSMVDKVEAARARVREEFQSRVAQAQQRWNELEKRAHTLVEQVQTSAQTAVERVREEKNEVAQKVEQQVQKVEQKVEQVAHDVSQRLGPVEHLLKLPAEAREDLLTNLGIASQKQVAQVHEEVAALSAEISAQFAAQTEALSQLLERHGGAESSATAAVPVNKPRAKKKSEPEQGAATHS